MFNTKKLKNVIANFFALFLIGDISYTNLVLTIYKVLMFQNSHPEYNMCLGSLEKVRERVSCSTKRTIFSCR